MGNSLSDTNGPNGSWTGYLAPPLAAAAITQVGTAPLPAGGTRATTLTPTAPHVWLNNAHSGDSCLEMIASGKAAAMVALKPDIVFWCFFGRNCVVGRLGGGSPSRATCAANHLSIAQAIVASGAQLLMTSPVCEGELFPDGANANDTELDAQDTIQATAASAAGAQYLSVRAPHFTRMAIVNPGNTPTGHDTSDGVHLWSAGSGGQQWAAGLVLAQCGFTA
jgi:hypothetical protein